MSTYQKAQQLVNEFIKNENLKKHCYAVETCMRFYAKKFRENEEDWGVAGLLHDIDWETNPDTHPNTSVPILEKAGFKPEVIHAILGHAYPARTNVARETLMDKYLFACDELSGFITAYSYMKGGIQNVDAKNVVKKLKDKAFARNVSRDDITQGAQEIRIPLEEHVANLLAAMKGDEKIS